MGNTKLITRLEFEGYIFASSVSSAALTILIAALVLIGRAGIFMWTGKVFTEGLKNFWVNLGFLSLGLFIGLTVIFMIKIFHDISKKPAPTQIPRVMRH